ncbi:MAG TPA: hypothetical protein VMF30_16305 [Pirellulales bacterium]|nr:hypothetical protein [Pirellulales bacterium]
MSPDQNIAAHNPFATRRVRPGAIDFIFPPGLSAAHVVDRLAGHAWRGQIVGAHGSGKSTLLAALAPAIAARGRRMYTIALHDGQRRLPEQTELLGDLDEQSLLVIDGYEQLGHWARWWIGRACRRQRFGLLVTTHRPVGLPSVFETQTTVALAQCVVAGLTGGVATIDRAEITALFAARKGNLRELLFDCYNLYRRRDGDAVAARPAGL